VLFGLAIAVFAWGTQYKVSLYDPPQAASHSIPPAKLLSDDQQTPFEKGFLTEKSAPSDGRSSPRVRFVELTGDHVTLRSLGVFAEGAYGQRELRVFRIWSLRRRASLSTFSLRPPPSRA